MESTRSQYARNGRRMMRASNQRRTTFTSRETLAVFAIGFVVGLWVGVIALGIEVLL